MNGFAFFIDHQSPAECQPDVFAVRTQPVPQVEYLTISMETTGTYTSGWYIERGDLLTHCEPISEAEARQLRPALFDRLRHEK